MTVSKMHIEGQNSGYSSVIVTLFIGLGIIGIAIAAIMQNMLVLLALAGTPLMILLLVLMLKQPLLSFFVSFVFIYFAIPIIKYTGLDGVSYIVDGVLFFSILLLLIDPKLNRGRNVLTKCSNVLLGGMIFWCIYCVLELANPTSVTEAWLGSRAVVFNGVVMTFLAILAIDSFKTVKQILFLLSILTLLAVFKALVQKYIGWDTMELNWLSTGGAKTHILGTGTRYFSFFTDAGNFGSNMGFAGAVFMFIALFEKKLLLKVYYFTVSVLGFYALFMSGTRGAIIVPLVTFLVMAIICRKVKMLIMLGSLLVIVFIFFRYTYIGQGNTMIRRMRTAFRAEEDASYLVRKNNQALLSEYIKDRPFGVGIGLSGVENRKYSSIFSTQVPHDSWYVKIWVETGIVGFIFYMGILLLAIAQAAWRLMFKVKDVNIRYVLGAWLSGICGLLVSAYGNAFWGQFPTNIIVFTGLVAALNGEYFEKMLTDKTQNSK